jgi:XTP/dITP diphosphohydrolase
VATKNPGKAQELEELLQPHGLHAVGPERMRDLPAPVEDGTTFRANAVKKALHYSRLVDLPVLADDSGLEVDALGGRPGVRSARLGGPSASDADRVRLVLSQLEGVAWEDRTARFQCVIAVARGDVLLSEFTGAVEGRVAFEPAGAGGFGYDPIFYYEPAAMTFSEMTAEEKHRVSHRGQALERAVGWLLEQPWARPGQS